MLRAALIACALMWGAVAGANAGLLPNVFDVIPGAAQGGRGDLVRLPAGTIEGVHVIQGGSRECLNPAESLPCRERKLSLNLDIGAGSTEHPGVLALNYDVGSCVILFDGMRHRLASFCKDGITFYRKPRIRR